MNVNDTGKELIKKWEGCKLTVYKDIAGHLTVGYGHKITSSDNLKEGDTISQSKANSFLSSDIKFVENAIDSHPKASKLTQDMYNATASLLFNVGTSPIKTKTNDLYKVLNDDNTYKSPISSSSKNAVITAFTYTKSNGVRVQGLVNRRNAELNVFLGTDNEEYISM